MKNILRFYFSILVLLIFTLSSCEISKLPLTISGSPQINKDRPADILPSSTIFENFHGLINQDNTKVFLEGEGNIVVIEKYDLSANNKNFNNIINKILPYACLTDTNIKDLPKPNRKYQQIDTFAHGLFQNRIVYLFPDKLRGIFALSFLTYNNADDEFQVNISKAIFYDGLNINIFTSPDAYDINFVGRKIILGPVCFWKNPHDIQCTDRGQMNWSVFNTLDKAKSFTDIQIAITKKQLKIYKEEDIDVVFEGKETKAKKLTCERPFPKYILAGTNNTLIIYYVTSEVRGKYIYCEMSFYEDQAKNGLPPLINEVMRLK
ncbi:MAG: hypothetical protein Q8880_09535 [Bacteroidota bacterium]|nr:hypothetical protein [Bacteroidota bacterium]